MEKSPGIDGKRNEQSSSPESIVDFDHGTKSASWDGEERSSGSNTMMGILDILKDKFRDRRIIASVVVGTLQLIITITLEILICLDHTNFQTKILPTLRFNNQNQETPMVVKNSGSLLIYFIIFCVGQVFNFFLLISSVVSSSVVELFTSVLINFALLLYSLLQIKQTIEVISAFEAIIMDSQKIELFNVLLFTAVAIVSLISFAVQACLSYYIGRSFGWRTFRELGADLNTKKQLRFCQVYTVLLKLSFFFFAGFDIQFLSLPTRKEGEQGSILNMGTPLTHFFIATPVIIVASFVAYYAQKRESKVLIWVAIVFFETGVVYLGLKIHDVLSPPANNPEKYVGSRNSILFFEVSTLILAQTTVIVAIINSWNFNKELTQTMNKSKEATKMKSRNRIEAAKHAKNDSSPQTPSIYLNQDI